jgi:uncharacterized protein (DUF58 family)
LSVAAGAVLAINALAAGVGLLDLGLALVPWVVLILAVAIDLALSTTRRETPVVAAPQEVFVGESATIQISNLPQRPGTTARFDWPEGLSGPSELEVDQATGQAAVVLRAVRRGVWPLRSVWLNWTSRFGLLEFVPKDPLAADIRVTPNIRATQSSELNTQIVSALYGMKENAALGDGSEFHQLREFAQGMDVKRIDWKRSARKRALVARDTRAERNHNVVLAFDCGLLMRERIGGLAKLDHAVTSALALGWAAVLGGDQVGHYAYDAQPRSFVKPQGGRIAFAHLRSWAASLDHVGRETNHTLGLSHLNASTPKRSLIVVFTDFVDATSAELMVENVGRLAKRHVILFVALRDESLEQTARARPDDIDGVATLVAAEHTAQERRTVLERLSRKGVTVIDCRPGQLTTRLVATYLDTKARELI